MFGKKETIMGKEIRTGSRTISEKTAQIKQGKGFFLTGKRMLFHYRMVKSAMRYRYPFLFFHVGNHALSFRSSEAAVTRVLSREIPIQSGRWIVVL